MSDVFISYKSEERAIAAALADYLEERGYQVWWDAALLAGAKFQKVLLNQIKITKTVVVIWSERSVESDFVLDEATRAKSLDKLTPLRIDGVELPLGFGVTQTLDLTGWSGDVRDPRLGGLAEAVGEKVGRAPAWPQPEEDVQVPSELPSVRGPSDTVEVSITEAEAPASATSRALTASPELEAEATLWADALESGNLGQMRAYLRQYGANGIFADQASFELGRRRLRRNAITFGTIFSGLFLGGISLGYAEFESLLFSVSGVLWGGVWNDTQILPLGILPIMLVIAMLYVTVRSRFLALRSIPRATIDLFGKDTARPTHKGSMSGKEAFWTALCAVLGTGNVFGVAVAVSLGGPSALVWMFVTSIFALSLIHADAYLAVTFQEKNDRHGVFGGAMHYLSNGLGWAGMPLAALFLIGLLGSSVTTGTTIQASSIANSVSSATGASLTIIGGAIALLMLLIMSFGARGIGTACRVLGPLLVLVLTSLGVWACASNPEKLLLVLSSAISGESMGQDAAAGVAGGSIAAAVRYGVARGLFSTEAGQGTTGVFHGSSSGTSAHREAGLASLVLVFDTIIVNVLMALVVLIGATSVLQDGQLVWAIQGEEYSPRSAVHYAWAQITGVDNIYGWVLAGLALSTMISWAFLSERALAYIVGPWFAIYFRALWAGLIFVGATGAVSLGFAWGLGDLWNALMAVSALTGILVLSRHVRAAPSRK